MEKMNIIKFGFTKKLVDLDQILDEIVEQDSAIKVLELNQEQELLEYLTKPKPVIVLAMMNDQKDYSRHLHFCRYNRLLIKQLKNKYVILNSLADKNIHATFSKMGCSDFLDQNLKAKNLKYKLEIWIKSLLAQNNPQTPEKSKIEVKAVAGVEDPRDIWLWRSEQDVKKVLNKGFFKLMGPGPSVAEWCELKPEMYVFKINPDYQERLGLGNDCLWIFEGETKPEFDLNENLWIFITDGGKLYLQDFPQFEKFKIKNNEIFIAQNSKIAKSKQGVIIDSSKLYIKSNENSHKVHNDEFVLTHAYVEAELHPEIVENVELQIYFKEFGKDHSPHYLCKICDLDEDSICLQVRLTHFKEREKFQIYFKTKYLGVQIEDHVIGTIKQIQERKGIVYLHFKLEAQESRKLQPLLNNLEQRQEQILNFLQQVKGI